ncbi:MAG: GH1 family beta-glucosidase [Gaiellaceae bacterium]
MTTFPDGFLWGVTTSAYQIEGAVTADGRGPSIWDTFVHEPGRIVHGDTGDVAADHYHRLEQDLDLLTELDIKAYRFSIAWPRVQPDGKGKLNQAGLDFYHRVLDGLEARGIEPMVTLYHWDLPQALDDGGGWLSRDTAARFADYAAAMVMEFSDKARLWVTLNEPWCAAFLGYYEGRFAPGHRDYAEAYTAVHHLLLAHGLGLAAIRDVSASAQVGLTCNLADIAAATNEDAEAARAADMEENRVFLDPVFHGRYPADAPDLLRDERLVQAGDLEAISAPLDFYGLNYYIRETVANDPAEPNRGWRRVPAVGDLTSKGDGIAPDGLTRVLLRVKDDYAPDLPIYITESGAPYNDYIDPDGRVNDPERIDYLRRHFEAAHEALTSGVDLRGYFVWSLLDNFEWDSGYSMRFGLVFVDYSTQRRIPKSSAHWYRSVINANGLATTDAAEVVVPVD